MNTSNSRDTAHSELIQTYLQAKDNSEQPSYCLARTHNSSDKWLQIRIDGTNLNIEEIGELHLEPVPLNTEQIASDISFCAIHAVEKYREEIGHSVQPYLDLHDYSDAVTDTIEDEWQSASVETVGTALRQGEAEYNGEYAWIPHAKNSLHDVVRDSLSQFDISDQNVECQNSVAFDIVRGALTAAVCVHRLDLSCPRLGYLAKVELRNTVEQC